MRKNQTMGTMQDPPGLQAPLHAPAHRKHKRSLQRIAALLVLALPTAFLLFGGQWLAAAGLGPSEEIQIAAEQEAGRMEAAKAETIAREAETAERAAAAAIVVPAYLPADPIPVVPGQTVVSVTFDDGFTGQARAAEILSAAKFKGTFYVNSGTLDEPGQLTLRQTKALALAGHEVAGHTFSHPDIDSLDNAEAAREICQDRKNLLDLGFEVTNFAYPFASGSSVKALTADCGYNSARGLGGTVGPVCVDCPVTESLRPLDPTLLKAPVQVEWDWTLEDLQGAVTAAEATGGWVILTFHGMCPYECNSIDIDEDRFQSFVDWLAERTLSEGTVVKTVQEVIGGPKKPAVDGPQAAPAAPGENGIKNAGLEDWTGDSPTCWTNAGYGINQAEFGKARGIGGSNGSGILMRGYQDGDAKLTPTQDLGACAPTVQAGHSYSLRAWYTADVRTQFSVQYRDSSGRWHYWVASPYFDPSSELVPAEWTTPPVPDGVTALSFGLGLSSEGYLVTDDYGLYDAEGAPPLPAKEASTAPADGADKPGGSG